MRILFVNERGGFFGGVEQSMHDAARALATKGIESHLAYDTESRDMALMCEPFASVHRVDVCGGETDGGDRETWGDLVAKLAPDVIFLHKVPTIAPFLKTRGNARVVRYIHDHNVCCPRHHKYYAWNQKICTRPMGLACYLDGAFLRRAPGGPAGLGWVSIPAARRELKRHRELDRLMVGSQFMVDELTMNGIDPGQIHRVPPVFAPWQAPESAPPIPDEPNLLFVGQLINGKGCDWLLETVAQLERPYRLRIAGEGNASAFLRTKAEQLGLGERVEFLGWVSPEDLAALYGWARVVAVPSRWPEPFGMIGVDAMRMARPIVGFASGGIPDWLRDGKNGYLSETGNIQHFTKTVDTLLGDLEICRAMGLCGWEMAHGEFSPEQSLQKLINVLVEK